MIVKIHKSYRDVVAICDKNLIGEILSEGDFCLEIKESFYNGKEVSKKELKKIMHDFSYEDATFNIVGKDSIKCALEEGLISKEGIKEIQGVPFALILL